MKKFIVLLFSAFCMNAFGQNPHVQWQKCLGGTASETANAIQQTFDGGYIVAGESSSSDGDITGNQGDYDFCIVKLNNSGIMQWQKSFGGGQTDAATSIQQTSDSGYIVAGYSKSSGGDVTVNHGDFDYWVIKLTATGVLQWQKSFGGTGSDKAYAVQQTSDGGYIVAGETSTNNNGDVTGNHGVINCWIVKLAGTGALQWQKCLGGTNWEIAHAIQQTTDGGYIIGAESFSTNGDVTGHHGTSVNDFWVVKLNSTGTIQWQKSLGGTSVEEGTAIQQTQDGGYIVAGSTGSTDGDVTGLHIGGLDYWVVKLNTTGAIQWQKTLGGAYAEVPNSVQQTLEGGYIVTGLSRSNDGDVTGHHGALDVNDVWVVKLSNTGSLQWQKSLGGPSQDEAYAIKQTSDGNYILAGYSSLDGGDVTGIHNSTRDFWIVKLNAGVGINEPENKTNFTIYPNPVGDMLSLTVNSNNLGSPFCLSDPLGRIILNGELTSVNFSINISDLPSGMYILTVGTDNPQSIKVVKQ
jgi:hypothetical protein